MHLLSANQLFPGFFKLKIKVRPFASQCFFAVELGETAVLHDRQRSMSWCRLAPTDAAVPVYFSSFVRNSMRTVRVDAITVVRTIGIERTICRRGHRIPGFVT